ASNGRVKCWGYNSIYGSVGIGTEEYIIYPPTLTTDTSAYSFISVGQHSCGIIAGTGQVKCWGYNDSGQLGNGDTTTRLNPTAITDTSAYSSISVGIYSTCGILASNGQVKCWGRNDHGQLGNGDYTNRSNPTSINDSSAYLSISIGADHACGVLASTGRVKCWGWNVTGTLGTGNTTDSPNPIFTNDASTYGAPTCSYASAVVNEMLSNPYRPNIYGGSSGGPGLECGMSFTTKSQLLRVTNLKLAANTSGLANPPAYAYLRSAGCAGPNLVGGSVVNLGVDIDYTLSPNTTYCVVATNNGGYTDLMGGDRYGTLPRFPSDSTHITWINEWSMYVGGNPWFYTSEGWAGALAFQSITTQAYTCG
ncbi:MAG: hypothetical protein WCF78_04910, partial [archaeon]